MKTIKLNNFIALSLAVLVASCGGHMPVAQPQAVADESYVLSFTRINLVESEAQYHFQLCRQPTKAESIEGIETEDIETEDIETESKEQACFNPFEDKHGNPILFTAMPEAEGLREKGVQGKALRYAVGTGAVLFFGALALVLVPKAAHLAFTKMLELRKVAISGEADKVVMHIAETAADKKAKKSANKAMAKAHKQGKEFSKQDYQTHYERVWKEIKANKLQETQKNFSIFATKPALFFTSLFIASGTIGMWHFSYTSWQDTNKQLAKWNWGQKELDLAEAYPFLTSSEPYRVVSTKELLATLRQHLQLIYSEAYLREFPPPPKEESTTTEITLPW